MKEGPEERRASLARADRQQDFFAQRILELREVQRRFTFVTQDLEHGRPTLVGHFHTAIFEVHYVHL